jgi:chloride channel 2
MVGLMVGKKGPFVHISAMIANLLSKITIFHGIRKVRQLMGNSHSSNKRLNQLLQNRQLLQQMIAVGCGMGVASNFGSPIGGTRATSVLSFVCNTPVPVGVLFSIEVTSTYYPVRNYFYAFKCATVATLLYRFLNGHPASLPTNFGPTPWVYAELICFGLLGKQLI